MTNVPNPLAVEVTRGLNSDATYIESRHRAACAVVDANGVVLEAWGDVSKQVFPRSAIKMIQALPIIESGAAKAFNLQAAELSLACASHNAENRHIRTVKKVLSKAGLRTEALECGPQISASEEIRDQRLRNGIVPNSLRNNCSGKHMGFLVTAKHLGEETSGYIHRQHPVQKRVAQVISDMCDYDLSHTAWGIDGCSIPAYALPLKNLAQGMARLAAPKSLGSVRESACRRLVEAVSAEPFMIAGSGRFCTDMNRVLKGKAIVKTGAEGVMMATVPITGVGIALKVDDGASRANGVALAAVLSHLGILEPADTGEIANHIAIPITDLNGQPVGAVRAVANWPPYQARSK